jgi:uncharacterized protein (DUF885 family)
VTETAAHFRALASEVVEEILYQEPELATALGDHRYDGHLNDRSIEGRSEMAATYSARLDSLAEVDTSELDADDEVDASILRVALEWRIFALEELREVEWNPLAYSFGDAIYPLLARATLPAADRLRAVAARLFQLPRLVELACAQLRRAPRVHVETALSQNRGTLALVRDEVARVLAEAPEMAATVERAQQLATGALERYGSFLEELSERADEGFRLGPERFEHKLRLALHSGLAPAEVLALAYENLERTNEALHEAACRYLGVGGADEPAASTVRAALDRLAADHPDDTTIVAEATTCLAGLAEAVARLGLAAVPDDPLRVEVMPEFRRGVAVAYCDSPGPFEDGGETFLAVAPTPAGWAPARVESFYREYNSSALVNLMAHEGVPGHGLQLAHGRRFSGPTPVRRAFRSGTFCEGWAVHAERLMAEAGHGGLPVRLQQLKMQMRVTLNAILDAEIHAGDLSEQAALDLMTRRGYQEEGEAVGKWRRACMTSAQLSTYFVGYCELADLFASLGPRARYDDVLAHGSPPPSLLARLLRAA